MYSKEILSSLLQNFIEEQGYVPTVRQLKFTNLPSAGTYVKHFGSWKNALQFFKENSRKKNLIVSLSEFIEKNKFIPKKEELVKNNLPSISSYEKYFGTWENCLAFCGIKDTEEFYERVKKEKTKNTGYTYIYGSSNHTVNNLMELIQEVNS